MHSSSVTIKEHAYSDYTSEFEVNSACVVTFELLISGNAILLSIVVT